MWKLHTNGNLWTYTSGINEQVHCPCVSHNDVQRGTAAQLHSFLASALDGGQQWASCAGRFYTSKRPSGTYWIRWMEGWTLRTVWTFRRREEPVLCLVNSNPALSSPQPITTTTAPSCTHISHVKCRGRCMRIASNLVIFQTITFYSSFLCPKGSEWYELKSGNTWLSVLLSVVLEANYSSITAKAFPLFLCRAAIWNVHILLICLFFFFGDVVCSTHIRQKTGWIVNK